MLEQVNSGSQKLIQKILKKNGKICFNKFSNQILIPQNLRKIEHKMRKLKIKIKTVFGQMFGILTLYVFAKY